jgi:diaminopimelate epimerase
MIQQPFVKLHGAGNDFVFLDLRKRPEILSPSQSARLCHRNFGIGADGVLAFVGVEDNIPRMKIYNADGSVPEMCGNGLRCFVKALVDQGSFTDNPLSVHTDAGLMTCTWVREDEEMQVDVAMGPVHNFTGTALLTAGVPLESLDIAGQSISFRRASTGNPHITIFEPVGEQELVGPLLATHPSFPEGVNVGFARLVTPECLDLVVCERGVGFTLACGTGSVAAAALAVSAGLCQPEKAIDVRLPGGNLRVTISADFSSAQLRGPAVEVFRGIADITGEQ